MDTKLKSNRWGGLVALLVILGAAAGLMALYPFIRAQAYAGAARITDLILERNAFSGYVARIGGQLYAFENEMKLREIAAWAILAMGALVALTAFILGLIKPLGMTAKRLFAAPFEIVVVVGYFLAALIGVNSYSIGNLIFSTAIGEVQTMFMHELYMSSFQADAAVLVINFLIWAVGAFLIYWIVTCLTAVFNMGAVRYMKERTIIGRFSLWCIRLFKNGYTLVETIDLREKSTKTLLKIVGLNFLLLTIISCFWFFGIFGLIIYSAVLFFVLRKTYCKMQENYQILLKATNQLAEGNLDVEIKEDLGVFEPFRGEIGKIQAGFKKAVEEEVKSQSMRTELITNVSHDLKTPLTAIITYVNLLKKDDITKEERDSYIQVLDQKSLRLKSLIEDLFEVSKANSKNVTLNLVEVDIVSLMKQVRLELDDKIQEAQIDLRWNLPEKKVVLSLDSDKTYRVFENLLVNVLKYSLNGTRAYIDIEENEGEVIVSMKNISATEISLNGVQLSDRFVRGDASRGTEGSGLGLAIAKSFVELQKGKFEVAIEADLFKVMIVWKEE